MHPKVEDALRRAALKKLFSDPHFNMPDPFEPYSGDWTVGEPISEEMLATLNQARTLLFDKRRKKGAGDGRVEGGRRRALPKRNRNRKRKTMRLEGKTLKVCSCNRTVAIDAKALGAALEAERAALGAPPALPQGRRRLPGGARRRPTT